MQKIKKNIFIPSYDKTPLEVRVKYWQDGLGRIVNGGNDIYKDNTSIYNSGIQNSSIGSSNDNEVEINGIKAVIISHPYGPLGGDFNNNVVVAVEHYFLSMGYLTVAFNFRGVGNSGGRTSWSGEPECGDYKSIVEVLLNSGRTKDEIIIELPKISELIIVGYSYGSLIASSFTTSLSIPTFYILISYPLSVRWFLTFFHTSTYINHLISLINSNSKVLFIYGNYDQFTRSSRFKNWVRENNLINNPRWTIKELRGADHFYVTGSMEISLIQELNEWINNTSTNRINNDDGDELLVENNKSEGMDLKNSNNSSNAENSNN
ncbi:hypothetical protein Glove_350g148 [Diversispora epigaea]|uniref:Xaa-Pro dipeptidyl-peptidase-like domain-containing protein n=1 Tax=Diversispora epigaea TaxID=1348612 RepID=A0A397HHH1_9GLOM|nr:hypothetical protein Glove_350g148 [Diversispora epigaea]